MRVNSDRLDELIRDYINNRRPRLAGRIENFRTKPLSANVAMPNRPISVRETVDSYAPQFLPLLHDCETLQDVMDVLFVFFDDHKIQQLGEESIMAYAEQYAYHHDLEMEANCCCLLTTKTKTLMLKDGLDISKFNDSLKEAYPNLNGLSSRELVDFLNRNSKILF